MDITITEREAKRIAAMLDYIKEETPDSRIGKEAADLARYMWKRLAEATERQAKVRALVCQEGTPREEE